MLSSSSTLGARRRSLCQVLVAKRLFHELQRSGCRRVAVQMPARAGTRLGPRAAAATVAMRAAHAGRWSFRRPPSGRSFHLQRSTFALLNAAPLRSSRRSIYHRSLFHRRSRFGERHLLRPPPRSPYSPQPPDLARRHPTGPPLAIFAARAAALCSAALVGVPSEELAGSAFFASSSSDDCCCGCGRG